jgi:hypothetical protein
MLIAVGHKREDNLHSLTAERGSYLVGRNDQNNLHGNNVYLFPRVSDAGGQVERMASLCHDTPPPPPNQHQPPPRKPSWIPEARPEDHLDPKDPGIESKDFLHITAAAMPLGGMGKSITPSVSSPTLAPTKARQCARSFA